VDSDNIRLAEVRAVRVLALILQMHSINITFIHVYDDNINHVKQTVLAVIMSNT